MDESTQQRFERELSNASQMLKDYSMRFAKNKDDAEDLYQSTALKAFDKFDRFKDGTSFKSWSYVIMRNTWFDLCDKRSRRKEMLGRIDSTEDYYSEMDLQSLSHDRKGPLDASDLYLEELIHPILVEAVTSLPEPLRTAVYLVDIRGLSYQQAADVINTTSDAIKGRLNRGRIQMRTFVASTNLLGELS